MVMNAHEIHDGHAQALRESFAADPFPVEWLVVLVVLLIVIVVLFALGSRMLPVLWLSAASPPTHKGDQLGDEIVNVEGARAGFHRARFGGVHVGRGQEKGRVERRFLWS
jgi:hypothetical protein